MALVTRDPTAYAEIAAVLREHRMRCVSLWPGERIPDQVAVVLTTPSEASTIRHRRVVPIGPGTSPQSWIAAVSSALGPSEGEGELVLGIDPGPRPGFAVVDHGICLAQGTLEAPEATAPFARQLAHRFPDRRLRFRVGSGDPPSRARIVNSLWELHRPVELVDESGTTPRGHRRPRDPAAARRIALGRGRLVAGPAEVRITPGEVANLQRLSREGSGGRITISRADASRVLGGELTLGQAIEQGLRRYRRPAGEPTPPTGQPF